MVVWSLPKAQEPAIHFFEYTNSYMTPFVLFFFFFLAEMMVGEEKCAIQCFSLFLINAYEENEGKTLPM